MVRDGRSWSGHERNRFLLNDGAGEFADLSSVAGLDHDADGRALAMVDWDQDGDLDLWYRNRTAPRLRLMLNSHRSGKEDFVAVRLEGTRSNRDAIGAVVEVMVRGAEGRLVKSVRAGDLFLSQSSRWLHFGLGDGEAIESIRVLWPGGGKEEFSGARPGMAFLLKEGTGAAVEVERTKRTMMIAETREPLAQEGSARIVLPAKIPMPPMSYLDEASRWQFGAEKGVPRLLVFWSSSCEHCRRELLSMVKGAGELRRGGLHLVQALNVDGAEGRMEAAAMMRDEVKWPFSWGSLDGSSLDRLAEFQRALFDVTVPLSVPLALLCDREGNVAAIYRGELEAGTMVRDWKSLMDADEEARHALAPPFAGRWFTKSVDPVYALEFMARQFERRLPEDALFYLGAAREQATAKRRVAIEVELARKHHRFARDYKEARQPEVAAAHFQRALEADPQAEYFLDYGTMLASYGNLAEAEGMLSEALVMEPDLEPAKRALAMVRKLRAEGN